MRSHHEKAPYRNKGVFKVMDEDKFLWRAIILLTIVNKKILNYSIMIELLKKGDGGMCFQFLSFFSFTDISRKEILGRFGNTKLGYTILQENLD